MRKKKAKKLIRAVGVRLYAWIAILHHYPEMRVNSDSGDAIVALLQRLPGWGNYAVLSEYDLWYELTEKCDYSAGGAVAIGLMGKLPESREVWYAEVGPKYEAFIRNILPYLAATGYIGIYDRTHALSALGLYDIDKGGHF